MSLSHVRPSVCSSVAFFYLKFKILVDHALCTKWSLYWPPNIVKWKFVKVWCLTLKFDVRLQSLTLKLKFEFVEFLSESLKLTLKMTFAVGIKVWTWSLKLIFNADFWSWHFMLTLNLMCEVGLWSWGLKLNFEVEV